MSSSATATSPNPGSAMAETVNAEIAIVRKLQEEMNAMQQDRQTLLSQQSENEMVQAELNILDENSTVYKMVGPVLMKNDLEDAKETVKNRLEFIGKERERLEAQLREMEATGTASAAKVREMQGAMQKAAVEAANAAVAEAKESR